MKHYNNAIVYLSYCYKMILATLFDIVQRAKRSLAKSPLFIHYFPKVIIEKITGETFVARDEWTNDEFLMKNHWE